MSEYQKYSKLPYFGTVVSISKTQEQIKKLLRKYGLQAIKFVEGYNYEKYIAVIEFLLVQEDDVPLQFRFNVSLPENRKYQRQVFRSLFYYLKARFTAIDFGINTVEKEFMSELVMKLPDGTTGTMKEIYGNKILELRNSDNLLPFKESGKK